MKRALVLLAACLFGFGASEMVSHSRVAREWAERILAGNSDSILLAQKLRDASRAEVISDGQIEREFNLLQAQFGDDAAFAQDLARSGLTSDSLRAELAENLRERAWIEKQIAPALAVTEAEAQAFYDAKRQQFEQPQRDRASHIFLAAPVGSPPELIAGKQSAIQGLSVRLLAGEDFSQVAAEASEDEATKARGGDLNYFSSARVPPEFFAEIEKLHPGEVSAPIQSHLGFHLVRLTEAKPPRQMNFDEVEAEIRNSLGNLKRATAVAQLRAQLLLR